MTGENKMSTITEAALATQKTKDFEEMLEKHRLLALTLAEVKKEEGELRDEIAIELSGMGYTQIGIHDIRIGNLDVKLTRSMKASVDVEIMERIYKDLSTAEADCVKFAPTIVAKKYKALEIKNPLLNKAIITKESKPKVVITLAED